MSGGTKVTGEYCPPGHFVGGQYSLVHRERAHAQELHDVRVAEGAHQLTFPHKLDRRFVDFVIRNLGAVLEDVVDLFSGGAYRYRHLLHAAVGSSTDSSASEPHVGEHERPQPRVVTKKIFRHNYCL